MDGRLKNWYNKYVNITPISPADNQQQKLIMLMAALFGAATLIFGIINWRAQIFRPFIRKGPAVELKSTAELEQDRRESLKTKDTDKDSLSDYDELYIYRTSPFLEDSDSDTFFDSDEIARGSDPNCPEGQTCRQPRSTGEAMTTPPTVEMPPSGVSTTEPSATDQAAAAAAQALVETFGDITAMTAEQIQAKLNSLSSRELKDFFIRVGLPQDTVEQASDDLLRQLFMETLRETGAPGATPAGSRGQ